MLCHQRGDLLVPEADLFDLSRPLRHRVELPPKPSGTDFHQQSPILVPLADLWTLDDAEELMA